MWRSTVVCVVFLFFLENLVVCTSTDDEDQGPVIPPSKCEVCKFLAIELKARLEETGKTKEEIQIGQKIKIKYNTADLRLIELLTDPHICNIMFEYDIHKERSGSNRYARGENETLKTLKIILLHNVPVLKSQQGCEIPMPSLSDSYIYVCRQENISIPLVWGQCFSVVEQYEEDIEDWYFSNQDKDIIDYLCRERVLKYENQECLDEVYVPKGQQDDGIEEDKSSKKSKSKKNKNKGKLKGDNGEHTES